MKGIAPEDSSQWKCKWITCENGCGLTGNGCCSARGDWDNPDCSKYMMATCQHGVKVDKVCIKCQKLNKRILLTFRRVARSEG